MTNYQKYIQNRSDLFWSVSPQKRDSISETLLIETILNYGSLDDTKELFQLVGLEKVALVFSESTKNNQRNNYLPVVENYFRLYFNRHAPQYSI